jgi:hypothetical protein
MLDALLVVVTSLVSLSVFLVPYHAPLDAASSQSCR